MSDVYKTYRNNSGETLKIVYAENCDSPLEDSDHLFKGTIYQFTLNTIYSAYENMKKASSKRKSSFSCLFQKFILK